ncbi:rasGEF domain-containing protein [Naegleria gruberi]|uniref:RasGEF domain-containing protein n=1 Tax=Naegleria gruberi TaxID=5762 RepID=D2VAC9_NAEGR|nr:rasGEF domain-containing protein [Naegleria gruberi]EFC46408.1 rasGEF domain-containing protein [Naegleria gruberi]|eukprot:XP_002679152.1 rasGEF domain-containing protein [Naegleria gruberi strain NEG-M]
MTTTSTTPIIISPSTSDKIVYNEDEYYDEDTFSNPTPTINIKNYSSPSSSNNNNRVQQQNSRSLSPLSLSPRKTSHYLHASQIKNRRNSSPYSDDESNSCNQLDDDLLLFDVEDISDVDTLRNTILDLHKKLVRAKRNLLEKDELIKSLRLTIHKQQQDYESLSDNYDDDDNEKIERLLSPSTIPNTGSELSLSPPTTSTNQSISLHSSNSPTPSSPFVNSGVQSFKKKIVIRKSSKAPTADSSPVTTNDNQSTTPTEEVKRPVFRKSSLSEGTSSTTTTTAAEDVMLSSPRLELIGTPRGLRERLGSSSATSSVSSPGDITQLTDEDIKTLSNRRKRNNQLFIDSPNVDSKVIDISNNLLSDYDDITNNQLYGLQEVESFFFKGIYPDVDPIYEKYDFQEAQILATLDFDLESASSSLILTASDLSKKARISKNRNNTISKTDTTNDSNQPSSSVAPTLQPFENYFICLKEKCLEPLFKSDNLDKYVGFNEEESPSNIVRDPTSNVVRAATLDKLIVLLTSNEEFENEYMYLFLLTYRSFTTPMDLLEKLILRFNTPPPQECLSLERDNKMEEMEATFQNFSSKILTPMRLRVGQVLSNWIQNHFYDFREDVELKFKLDSFIDEMYEIGMKTLSKTLRNLLQRSSKRKETFKVQQLEEVKHRHELQENLKTSGSKGSGTLLSLKKFKLLNRNSEENLKNIPLVHLGNNRLCLQLTLISYRLFEKLRPKEFLNQNWMKETRSKKAPNIYAMINRSNEIGMWVATDILSYEDVKERAYVLKQFIKIASECEKIRNYNTMYDIVAGLNSNPIHRLKKTWDLIPEKWKTRFQELLELTNPKKSYHAMREALSNNADKTVLPYIGMFLTDLLFIEEGNTDFTKEGNLINFSKRRLLGQLIRQIQTYQQGFYQIEIIPLLHQRLNHLIYRPMDELYEISCKLEVPPQVTKKKKKVIVYDEDDSSTTSSAAVSSTATTAVSTTNDQSPEDSNVLSNSNLSPNNNSDYLTKKRTSSAISLDSQTSNSEEMSESFDESSHELHITDI